MISILKKPTFLLYLTILTRTLPSSAQEFLPQSLVLQDDLFSKYVLLVEKASHSLLVFENHQGMPKLLNKYQIASGKYKGDKRSEGDHKTPEGIYTLKQFLSKEKLLKDYGDYAKMYGVGAFTTDYPNLMDSRLSKGGSGIWLHSTDDETRIEKGLDSRGCVVVGNQDLKEISRFLSMDKTPIIITQEIFYLPKATWELQKNEIKNVVSSWMDSWKGKKFDEYISFYHQQEFRDKSKGGFQAYKEYKRAVFARPDKPEIEFDGLSIFMSSHYAVAFMRQNYKSAIINDIGKKTLYLKKDDNYNWKIVAELWDRFEGVTQGFGVNSSNPFFN
jgi:murein L,D-transpeptidase YafK